MGFLDSAASGGIFSGLGSVASGWFNYKGQKAANQANRDIAGMTNQANRDIADMTNVANAKQAKDQMDFMERMSGTAYQRQMADMRAAGINPMLAASMGGASTPPGASIPAVTGAGAVTGAPIQNEMSGVGSAVNSAMDGIRLKYEVQQMQEGIKNLRETNSKIKSDTILNNALTRSAFEDSKLKANSAKVTATNDKLLNLSLPRAQLNADIDSSLFGKIMGYAERVSPLIGLGHSGVSIARNVAAKRASDSKKDYFASRALRHSQNL